MNFTTLKKHLLRLFNSYVKKHLNKLFIALGLSFGVAGSTAAIAWLLDPAIKKMFIEQDRSMMYLIPIGIVSAFLVKGSTLYFARTILIRIGNTVVKELQNQLSMSVLKSDTNTLESKHSGKFISHFLYDVGQANQLVSSGVLNIMKDSLTLIVLVGLMFYQNWKLALFAMILMPFAAFIAKSLGKRMGKATKESIVVTGSLTSFLSEMLKGARMIKIYQQEKFELDRSDKIFTSLMDKRNKVGFVLVRATPIMEVLTGIMIASFIYYSGFIIASGEMGINNFFSFLTAMMLAYQPIRSLATVNMLFYQGAAGAERVFEVIDTEPNIKENDSAPNLKINKGKIDFKNVTFAYPNTNA